MENKRGAVQLTLLKKRMLTEMNQTGVRHELLLEDWSECVDVRNRRCEVGLASLAREMVKAVQANEPIDKIQDTLATVPVLGQSLSPLAPVG